MLFLCWEKNFNKKEIFRCFSRCRRMNIWESFHYISRPSIYVTEPKSGWNRVSLSWAILISTPARREWKVRFSIKRSRFHVIRFCAVAEIKNETCSEHKPGLSLLFFPPLQKNKFYIIHSYNRKATCTVCWSRAQWMLSYRISLGRILRFKRFREWQWQGSTVQQKTWTEER